MRGGKLTQKEGNYNPNRLKGGAVEYPPSVRKEADKECRGRGGDTEREGNQEVKGVFRERDHRAGKNRVGHGDGLKTSIQFRGGIISEDSRGNYYRTKERGGAGRME